MFVAAPATMTPQGAAINESDYYVNDLKVLRFTAAVKYIPHTKEEGSCPESAAFTTLRVGNCSVIRVDGETGFVDLLPVMRYTELVCDGISVADIKAAFKAWMKKPVAVANQSKLLTRDRGTDQKIFTEDGTVRLCVHPIQVFANVDVGPGTRTWLMSTAAFALSFQQLTKAITMVPQDFSRFSEHIEALQNRIRVLHKKRKAEAILKAALAATPSPYADVDWKPLALETINRLAFLARCDLSVLKYNKRIATGSKTGGEDDREVGSDDEERPAGDKKAKRSALEDKKKESSTFTCQLADAQLKFLNTIIRENGDLWIETSAHAYPIAEDRSGAVVVLPSGHLYAVTSGPGIDARTLIKERAQVARFESILPYIPFELTGFSGDITKLAGLEAGKRRGKPTAPPTKADIETVKANVCAFALRLANTIIASPELSFLIKQVADKQPAAADVAVPPVTKPPTVSSSSRARAAAAEPVVKERSPSPRRPVPQATSSSQHEEDEEEEGEEEEEEQ